MVARATASTRFVTFESRLSGVAHHKGGWSLSTTQRNGHAPACCCLLRRVPQPHRERVGLHGRPLVPPQLVVAARRGRQPHRQRVAPLAAHVRRPQRDARRRPRGRISVRQHDVGGGVQEDGAVHVGRGRLRVHRPERRAKNNELRRRRERAPVRAVVALVRLRERERELRPGGRLRRVPQERVRGGQLALRVVHRRGLPGDRVHRRRRRLRGRHVQGLMRALRLRVVDERVVPPHLGRHGRRRRRRRRLRRRGGHRR